MKVFVVIPCYKVSKHILPLIQKIGPEVDKIIAVDDSCPESSGLLLKSKCKDGRLKIIYNDVNLGVGGSMIAGYKQSIIDGADIVVKIDGDGQMDPKLIQAFIQPIITNKADYTKGNRFFDLKEIRQMPASRIIGNAVLSFLTKFSTGYWNIFDPTNGYTAISSKALVTLDFEKISNRFFFESDMLFRLGIGRYVVKDIPIHSIYGEEVSNLKIYKAIPEFLYKNLINFFKRIFYNYYLRDMNLASIELPFGFLMFFYGLYLAFSSWSNSHLTGISSPTGSLMLAMILITLGFQLLLSFFSFDISNTPKK